MYQMEYIGDSISDTGMILSIEVNKYDLAVIELPEKIDESVFKRLFYLRCKRKLFILALGYRYSVFEHLLLDKFGIENYAEKDDLFEIRYKLDLMIKKIKIFDEISENMKTDGK